MSDTLSRRYRRLLRVYPPGARRDELLDTLLASAKPGRRRPTVRESANLLRHGLRARLGRPGSTAVVVFAVLVALVGGFLGAAGAARLSWEAARPLPSGAEAEQLKATVFPGMTVWGGGDAALFVTSNDTEDIQYGYADYWVKHTPATRDVRAFTEAARDRLAAAGWHIHGDVVPDFLPGTWKFRATRGGLAIDFSNFYWPHPAATDSDGAALFHLSRTTPPWVDPATGLGALIGALIGWLLTGWVSRRTERSAQASWLVGMATGLAVLFLQPAILLVALGTVVMNLDGSVPPEQQPLAPFWTGLLLLGRGPAKVAAVLGAVVAVVAAWPRRRPPLPDRPLRRPAEPASWRTQVVPFVAILAILTLVWAGSWGRAGNGLRAAEAAWAGQCTPTGPPAEPNPSDARLTRTALVFISPESTVHQVELVQSAIMRVAATAGTNVNRDPSSREFQTTYCGNARLPPAIGAKMPWYFTVWLTSPGAFPALVAEVAQLPGVIAVRHAPHANW